VRPVRGRTSHGTGGRHPPGGRPEAAPPGAAAVRSAAATAIRPTLANVSFFLRQSPELTPTGVRTAVAAAGHDKRKRSRQTAASQGRAAKRLNNRPDKALGRRSYRLDMIASFALSCRGATGQNFRPTCFELATPPSDRRCARCPP